MTTDATTPAARALARIDAMTALAAPVAEYYVAAPAPLLALARAAVARAEAWGVAHRVAGEVPAPAERAALWEAGRDSDDALDAAVAALIAALAEPPA